MKYLKDERIRKILFVITFTVLLLAIVWNYTVIFNVFENVLNIFYPFIMGGIYAFIMNVLLRFYELHVFKNVSFALKNGRSFKRGICLTLTVLSMIGIIFIVSFMLVPRMVEAILAIVEQLNVFLPNALNYIENYVKNHRELQDFLMNLNIDYASTLKGLASSLTNNIMAIFSNASNLITNAFGIASSIAGKLFTFMISFIFALYLLIQKEKLSVHLRLVMQAFFPDKLRCKMKHVLTLSFETFSNFVTGQGLEAVVLGCLVGGCCWIFKLSYASVVGVIAAMCSFIPMFGSMLALVVGTLIQLIVSPYQALFFLVMMTIIQQVDGNLIYPHIMGNRIGLPAMYVLIAFTVGGSLFGLFGMLLFIPLTSILYDLFREWTFERIEKKKREKEEAVQES